MPQLRQNIITGDWVVIAPERAKRPSEFVVASQPSLIARGDCPFCVEGTNYNQLRLRHYETDLVYVIPNKYPAFVEDPTRCSERTFKVENDFGGDEKKHLGLIVGELSRPKKLANPRDFSKKRNFFFQMSLSLTPQPS